ncbi:hypothetical protein C8J56DRAFT_1051300 [Mycena floridula]|nr:hypothetical protein C8J56DRAFT_1051300 [Mycena floridula]
MATFQALPTELQLQIFQHSTLISLMRSRCVCQEWRSLVLNSDILSIRQKFYKIYLALIDSPEFLASRAYVLKQLKKGFKKGITLRLTTPERAVIASVWPSLPFEEAAEAIQSGASREGWSFLAEPVTESLN